MSAAPSTTIDPRCNTGPDGQGHVTNCACWAVIKCPCGQRARYHVFQALKPATVMCVTCADAAPFYVTIRRIEPDPRSRGASALFPRPAEGS